MKAYLIAFLLLLSGYYSGAAFANEACEQCMAQCPHLTKDFKACDRGCPEVCTKTRVAEIHKVQACETCLNQCPHDSRDFKPCDGGCVKDCDQRTLVELWRKTADQLKQCQGGSTPLPH